MEMNEEFYHETYEKTRKREKDIYQKTSRRGAEAQSFCP